MKIKLEELDSVAFDANVLKIEEFDEKINFKDFEEEYLKKYSPKYVYVKIPIEEISKIHYLEASSFQFVECQHRLFKRLTSLYDTSMFDDDLEIKTVSDEKDLEAIKLISDKIFDKIDRLSVDEEISNEIAKKRYHIYLEKSFEAKNQRIGKLLDKKTDKIIGFHTHLYKDEKSVLLLLGGILPQYQKTGVNFASDYYIFNDLYKSGHKNITTHISAGNVKMLNSLTKTIGFKLKSTFVILRKLYQ